MLTRTEFMDCSIKTSSLDDRIIFFAGNTVNSQLLKIKDFDSWCVYLISISGFECLSTSCDEKCCKHIDLARADLISLI